MRRDPSGTRKEKKEVRKVGRKEDCRQSGRESKGKKKNVESGREKKTWVSSQQTWETDVIRVFPFSTPADPLPLF
ncbi:hypothetical protein A7M65_19430 [Acinetobacter baumannii]|nr:hypothetical protein A7M65_19430 [Acinetobacter baumannii]